MIKIYSILFLIISLNINAQQSIQLKDISYSTFEDFDTPTNIPVKSYGEKLVGDRSISGHLKETFEVENAVINFLRLEIWATDFGLIFNNSKIDTLFLTQVKLYKLNLPVTIKDDPHTSLIISNSKINLLDISVEAEENENVYRPHYYIEKSQIKTITFDEFDDEGKDILEVNFDSSIIDTIKFEAAERVKFDFTNVKVKYLDFSYYSPIQILNLNYLNNTFLKANNCILKFSTAELDKYYFDYQYFKLNNNLDILHNENSYSSIINLLNSIITLQKKYEFKKGLEKAEIEKRNFILLHNFNFQEFLSKIWWNYGYNKEYIIYWLGGFFMIFFLFNLLIIRSMNKCVYNISSLNNYFENPSNWYYLTIGCFLYTTSIFFGLKLEIEKFVSKKAFGTSIGSIYILLVYSVGLFCVAFLGKYLLDL
jgi:hypothetical protein